MCWAVDMLCDLSNIGQVESTDKTDVAAAFELMQDEIFFINYPVFYKTFCLFQIAPLYFLK